MVLWLSGRGPALSRALVTGWVGVGLSCGLKDQWRGEYEEAARDRAEEDLGHAVRGFSVEGIAQAEDHAD